MSKKKHKKHKKYDPGFDVDVSPEFNIITEPEQEVGINNAKNGIAIAEVDEELAIARKASNAQTGNGDQALVGGKGIAIADPEETAVVGDDGTAQASGDDLTAAKDHSIAGEDEVTVANDNSNAATNINDNQQGRESGPGFVDQFNVL